MTLLNQKNVQIAAKSLAVSAGISESDLERRRGDVYVIGLPCDIGLHEPLWKAWETPAREVLAALSAANPRLYSVYSNPPEPEVGWCSHCGGHGSDPMMGNDVPCWMCRGTGQSRVNLSPAPIDTNGF